MSLGLCGSFLNTHKGRKVWRELIEKSILTKINYLFYNLGALAIWKQYYLKKNYKYLPIIVYHSVMEEVDEGYSISVKNFEKQMRYISKAFKPVKLSEIKSRLNENSDPKPGIIITFDDAEKCILDHVHPIMQRFDIPYTVFVATKYIGKSTSWTKIKKPIMNRDEIKELSNNELVDFGSHTVNHVSLAKLDYKSIRSELSESKKIVEEITGKSVELFAYPYGGYYDFSTFTIKALEKAGYTTAVTTVPGVMNKFENLLLLKRIHFNNSDNENTIRMKLAGMLDWQALKDMLMFRYRKVTKYRLNLIRK